MSKKTISIELDSDDLPLLIISMKDLHKHSAKECEKAAEMDDLSPEQYRTWSTSKDVQMSSLGILRSIENALVVDDLTKEL